MWVVCRLSFILSISFFPRIIYLLLPVLWSETALRQKYHEWRADRMSPASQETFLTWVASLTCCYFLRANRFPTKCLAWPTPQAEPVDPRVWEDDAQHTPVYRHIYSLNNIRFGRVSVRINVFIVEILGGTSAPEWMACQVGGADRYYYRTFPHALWLSRPIYEATHISLHSSIFKETEEIDPMVKCFLLTGFRERLPAFASHLFLVFQYLIFSCRRNAFRRVQ